MQELTDDVIHDIARELNVDYGDDDQYIMDFARAVIAADRELQSVRHVEELAAYELTVSNLRARCMPDIHALFWVLRSKILKLPRYSFLLNNGGGVSKVADKYGKWIEKDSAAELCEVESVDSMLSASPAPQAPPERKPMTDDDCVTLFRCVQRGMGFKDQDVVSFTSGVAAGEHFHGIKKTP